MPLCIDTGAWRSFCSGQQNVCVWWGVVKGVTKCHCLNHLDTWGHWNGCKSEPWRYLVVAEGRFMIWCFKNRDILASTNKSVDRHGWGWRTHEALGKSLLVLTETSHLLTSRSGFWMRYSMAHCMAMYWLLIQHQPP